jgi:hypothetical protein
MTGSPVIRQFAGPSGRLEALFETPEENPCAAVVFGHPHPLHGGTMHAKVVYRAAKTFLELGCAVLRFNFRGVGASAGHFDEGRGERDDFEAGLDFVAATCPGVDLWAAGFSFGAGIALTTGVQDRRVTQLLGIAPPIGRYDFADVAASRKPMHLIHGEADELMPVAQLREFYEIVSPPKTLTVIVGASHLFERHVPEVGDAIRITFGVHSREREQA